MNIDIGDLLLNLAFSAPLWLALLVCIVVCLIQVGRYPAPALLAAAGFALVLLTRLVALTVVHFIFPQLLKHAETPEQHVLPFRIADLATSIMYAIAFVLLLLGVVL